MAAYTLPDLAYDYGALAPAISGEILEMHHSKHHATYVKGANDTLDALAEVREKETIPPAALVGLEKTLAFNLSGHILHEIFWTNLTPGGGGEPEGELAAAIEENFGSFVGFKKQLQTATVSVQGSGWGVLGWEPTGQRLVVQQVYDHHGDVGIGAVPLLVFDAWEHAYYLQYKNVRPDYVTKLWDIVDWSNVAQRLPPARAERMSPALAEDVQLAAGVIAARQRGDLGGTEQLLAAFDSDADRARAFWMLAELALGLIRSHTGQTMDELVQELAVTVGSAGE